jgi:hypothetical protein
MTVSYSIRDNDQPGGRIWSKGGTGSVWSKSRKVWGSAGPFKNHLSLFYPFSGYRNLRRSGKSDDFYSGTLISKKDDFPYGGDSCVVIEVDEVANTVKEFPAARWMWNNCYFPRYLRESERKQQEIKDQLGVKGEITLTMLEPVHVDAVSQLDAFAPMSDSDVEQLLHDLGDEPTLTEVVRATEEFVRQRTITQRSKM